MPPAIALAGAAVVGAGAQIISGNKAASAQKKAAALSVAEQQRQYDQTRADYAPWRAAGTGALDLLTRAYGANGEAPDRTAFTESPGYQFRYDEGLRAVDRGAAARGLLHSGAAVKAKERFGQGEASSEYSNWFNQGLGLAGLGQNATAGTAQAGQSAANNISNAYTAAGNAQASSYANTGSAINSGLNNVLFSYLNGSGGKAPTTTGGPSYPNWNYGL